MNPHVTQTGIELSPDRTRVIARLFVAGREDVGPGDSRASAVIDRILELGDDEVDAAMLDLDGRFANRHRALHDTFRRHADLVRPRIGDAAVLSDARQLLLGAAFTHEYAIEGAALCNPSAVLHPLQGGNGDVRFVVSVRGIGEGHRSSIGFRTGTVSAAGAVTIDDPGPFPTTATTDLAAEVATRRHTSTTIDHLRGVARSSYSSTFPADSELSERVLWPQAPAESHGMEDARFVRFAADDGTTTYYATYTAFDGTHVAQHLLETTDFLSFTASPLAGDAAVGKGLALFPRMVDGRYAALSRSDRETNAIAFSDDMRCWNAAEVIQVPDHSWEILQLGNCGSPIETDAGWLVLTHGVGPMRTYSLGAILLDLEEPHRVRARSERPILSPDDGRRDGYVPNVIYSCGAFAHNDTLILPYGIADQTISIATLSINDLIDSMRPEPS